MKNAQTLVELLDTRIKGCSLEQDDKVNINPDVTPLGIYALACANCKFNGLQPDKPTCQAVRLPI